ncbi:sensor histidine kinase [Streptomyces roseirectus]|uniref:Sensor histidine kinase n=1 Tax=Streptomyces roseirectus TaxID=2768066 RepID=A0A7H0IQ87_9ACTN|nr:ATP-binding protein [Streptomyces roseirectus]QNP74953.1 sensor histidine kinase [Streptomyces roseirectus]
MSVSLLPAERRAIAPAATDRSHTEVLTHLVREGLPVPPGGLGSLWSAAAEKLGTRRVEGKGRQPELVYLAHVHGCPDAPLPRDPGPLPPDVLGLLRAPADGKTLSGYAKELGVRRTQTQALARYARTLLGAPTLACLVHRALPRLRHAGHTAPAAAAPVTASLQTELPGDASAVTAARGWVRATHAWLRWTGPAAHAAEAAGHLVANAVLHGLPEDTFHGHLLLKASATEASELLLDVTDHNPRFPQFDRSTGRAGADRGLRQIAWLGAQVTWRTAPNALGKTVRAAFPPARPLEEPA